MKLRLMALMVLVLGSVLGATTWRWLSAAPTAPRAEASQQESSSGGASPTPPPEETSIPAGPPTTGATAPERIAYVTSRDGTPLTGRGEQTALPIAGGILLPVLGEVAGSYRVFDTCNREGTVPSGEVQPGPVPDGSREGFDRSVFVIDPGHGIPDHGATGPTGLYESEVNLDVSARIVDLLGSPRSVDWETGTVTAGDEIPPAAVAVATRSPHGPNSGDYELGLEYRTTVANALEATALVSIHHNAGPEAALDHPGSEAYVSATDPESPRLGGLMVEELRRSLGRFQADWMGSEGTGLFSRVNAEGEDYYSILARSEVPAVIVEGAYISNPSEEALARTDEFRQAYAEAVYRALVRFVITDDDPIPPPEPELWQPGRPGPSVHDCQVPPP
ncbi:MAG: N-acetylmuramoyl-L-alanine amidase [Actinomycetota bacterium]